MGKRRYQKRARRYPVVYALHGYLIGANQWAGEIHVPQTIEGAFAKGAQAMIVVLPDSKTVHNGSMYSSSVTTGDFRALRGAYRAIAIDVGDQDGLRADAARLHDALDQYGIPNTFEIYAGTHTSEVAVRFQEHVVMPFFSRTLSFEPAKR